MSTFTASNGYKVTLNGDGANVYRGIMSTPIYPDEMLALREFFQAEEDKRHGRWRWPENPDYVVYPDGTSRRVVKESKGTSLVVSLFDRERMETYLDSYVGAALAYDAAHPEPKPEWHGAKEGEVWILKTERGFTLPMICQADAFRDHAGMFPLDSDKILEARRIWSPEDES